MRLRALNWSLVGGGVLLALWGGSGHGAELVLDFSREKPGQLPPGFRSALVGGGPPADWQVLWDEATPAFAPLTPEAPAVSKRAVVGQLSRDATDERFPLLIYEEETFGDFSLSVKVKLMGGVREQMAGLAFRLQDERNFYVVRASALGNTFRFYRVAQGQRDQPIGPELEIASGRWHELGVECQGNRIRLKLNGQQVIPDLTDNSFTAGKVALWTKSDSVAYFTDFRLDYRPRETLAQVLVRETLARYPRLLGVRIYARKTGQGELEVVASSDPGEVGQAGGQVEQAVIASNTIYSGKSGGRVLVTLPLHDRNGDPMAAVRLTMDSFPGQTDQNAVGRATPIVKRMQGRARSARELTE